MEAIAEREKYQRVWAIPAYRNFSPGEHVLPLFRQMVRGKPGSLVDIGAGTGRATQKLARLGWDVWAVDLVADANECPELRYLERDITEDVVWLREAHAKPKVWDQGYCCDVMEHLPQEKVDDALENIFCNCRRVFFSIHFGPDNFGKAIGHPLHLTVMPFEWWRAKLAAYGKVRQCRDLLGMGVFDVAGA